MSFEGSRNRFSI